MFTWKKYMSSEDKLAAFKEAVKSGEYIEGDAIEAVIDENEYADHEEDLIVDTEYDDFDNRGRWSIGKIYILNIDGEYYGCWENVGLTEMQESDFDDQYLVKMVQKEVAYKEWFPVEI